MIRSSRGIALAAMAAGINFADYGGGPYQVTRGRAWVLDTADDAKKRKAQKRARLITRRNKP